MMIAASASSIARQKYRKKWTIVGNSMNMLALLILCLASINHNSLCLAFSIQQQPQQQPPPHNNNHNNNNNNSNNPTTASCRSRFSPASLCSVASSTTLSRTSTSTTLYAEEENDTTTTTATSSLTTPPPPSPSEEEEEEEWELVEYEDLNEADFVNSEWKVGTLWNVKDDQIDTTWVRLVYDDDKNARAVWGDGSQGTWKIDEASQFFTVSKDTFGGWGGKKIWAGPIEDYYYLQGTVRGWNVISPAYVMAQWQMRRLGMDKDEAGVAPWDEDEDEEKE